MSERLRYSCGKCGKPISHDAWEITVRPDGKLRFVAHCHGETEERIVSVSLAGVMFTDVTPGTNEYGELWDRLAPPSSLMVQSL